MKKINVIILSAVFCLLMVSCGVNGTILENFNSNSTQVQLNKKNFKILERVTGSETTTYIFGIGGGSSQELNSNAISKMYQAANLKGSQAIINIVTEYHSSSFLIFYEKITVTVSGQVIEFTE